MNMRQRKRGYHRRRFAVVAKWLGFVMGRGYSAQHVQGKKGRSSVGLTTFRRNFNG